VVIQIDPVLAISPRHQMVKTSGYFNANASCHVFQLPAIPSLVQYNVLQPDP